MIVARGLGRGNFGAVLVSGGLGLNGTVVVPPDPGGEPGTGGGARGGRRMRLIVRDRGRQGRRLDEDMKIILQLWPVVQKL